MAGSIGLEPGRRVLDLAAGTGKLTRSLVATGADVVAVEPVSGMRDVLVRAVPEAAVAAAIAQSLPIGDGRVDAVTVAQAFHWFASAEVVAELHRVLAPGGQLAIVWNWRDLDDPLQAALHELLVPHRGGTPKSSSGVWRVVLDDDVAHGRHFAAADHMQLAWRQPTDVEGVARRITSMSFVSAMDDAARVRLLGQIRDVARAQPPPLSLAYTSEVACFRRVG